GHVECRTQRRTWSGCMALVGYVLRSLSPTCRHPKPQTLSSARISRHGSGCSETDCLSGNDFPKGDRPRPGAASRGSAPRSRTVGTRLPTLWSNMVPSLKAARFARPAPPSAKLLRSIYLCDYFGNKEFRDGVL